MLGAATGMVRCKVGAAGGGGARRREGERTAFAVRSCSKRSASDAKQISSENQKPRGCFISFFLEIVIKNTIILNLKHVESVLDSRVSELTIKHHQKKAI